MWSEDAYCPCGHMLDSHMDHCLVPDCDCARSIEAVERLNIQRMMNGQDVLTREEARKEQSE